MSCLLASITISPSFASELDSTAIGCSFGKVAGNFLTLLSYFEDITAVDGDLSAIAANLWPKRYEAISVYRNLFKSEPTSMK